MTTPDPARLLRGDCTLASSMQRVTGTDVAKMMCSEWMSQRATTRPPCETRRHYCTITIVVCPLLLTTGRKITLLPPNEYGQIFSSIS